MFVKIATATFALLALIVPSAAVGNGGTINVANQQLSFVAPNPPNATEVLAGADASTPPFRFDNVITVGGTQIDALATIVSLQNSESVSAAADNKMARVDVNDNDSLIETRFRNSAVTPTPGFAVYDLQFVLAGTNTPVILENVALTVRDIDNNQFVEFSGLTSYVLAAGRTSTEVNAFTGTASFTSSGGSALSAEVPPGSVLFFASASSSDDNEKHWVEAKFGSSSTLRVKLGSYQSGSANFDLDFQLASFNVTTDAAVTVNQPSFTITYDANTGSGSAPTATSGTGQLAVAGNSGSPTLTKAGFVFAGWNTRADGSGVSYSAGSTILPVADVTLFAMWTAASEPPVEPELARTGLGSPFAVGAIAAGALILAGFAATRRARRTP